MNSREYKKQLLKSTGVNPLWDLVGYVVGAIPFVWLANRYDRWEWLVVAVVQAGVQYWIGYQIIKRMQSGK